MANEGWRYEPARHALAAKGIETSGLTASIKIKDNPFATDYDGTPIVRRPNTDPSILSIGTPEYKEMVHKLIEKHNSGEHHSHRFGHIVFPNEEEAHLWIGEYIGQISDGKYENSRINWEAYIDLAVYVDPDATEAKLVVTDPYVFRRGLKFTDLLWLFDKEHASKVYNDQTKDVDYGARPWDPNDVRSVFSKVPTKRIKEYTVDIQNALRHPLLYRPSPPKEEKQRPSIGSVEDDDSGSETWA
jgi:hypothetical protein